MKISSPPGLWQYRVSAVAGGRTLLRGSLFVEVTERDGTRVRSIGLRRR